MSVETREMKEIEAAVEGILFASGEPVHIDRFCVAAVLALELVNSAIERAVDKPDTTHWWTAGAAKDMAAGAVLVMAIGTVVVAVCLFWPRLDILWAAFTARPTRPLWLLLTLIVFYKFIFRSSNSTEKGKQPNGKTDS